MKKILYITTIIILLFSFAVPSYSFDNVKEIWNSVDNETRDMLNDLGIDEVSFDDIFEISPSRVIKFIFSLAFEKGISVIDKLVVIFVVMIISAIAMSFVSESNDFKDIINYICVIIILSFIMEPIGRMLTDSAMAIMNTKIFVNTYLPIMTGIIIASKSPSLALTYNSFSLFISNIISVFSDKIFVPIISIMFSFSMISSFSVENFQSKVIKTIRRIIVVILSLFSTIYTGLLTTQSILASSSDSIALKGIKFVSGTFIPIVGGNVGDAISSVLSSFLIMKNTLGIFVIIVIILINLPIMIEMLIWYFVLSFSSIISTLLNMDTITDVLDSLSSTIALLNIILFFVTFVFVISTGIIIVMGKH